MRTTTLNVASGFAAGAFATIALTSMLGMMQPSDAQAISRRIEAYQRELDQAEDQRAESDTQVAFWQREMTSQDAEVTRLQFDPGTSPCVPYFLDRAKGLSSRASHSYLDARLRQAMTFRKVQALKAVAKAP